MEMGPRPPLEHLIVMIPCHNEAEHLPAVLADLPKELPGVGRIEVLVVDDHSTDATVAVAKAHGVAHVLSRNSGQPSLAQSFLAGVQEARRLGATVMVNTDGDHQYLGEGIPRLVAAVQGGAMLAVGVRGGEGRAKWPWWKTWLHGWAAQGMAWLSGAPCPDPNSGFRAWSREALARVQVQNTHSYVLETLLQANLGGWRVAWVDTPTQPPRRPSRLIRSVSGYVRRSATVALTSTWRWRPWRLAGPLALACGLVALGGLAAWALRPEPSPAWALASAWAGSALGLLSLAVGLLAQQEAWRLRVAEEALARVRLGESLSEAPQDAIAEALELSPGGLEAPQPGQPSTPGR